MTKKSVVLSLLLVCLSASPLLAQVSITPRLQYLIVNDSGFDTVNNRRESFEELGFVNSGLTVEYDLPEESWLSGSLVV